MVCGGTDLCVSLRQKIYECDCLGDLRARRDMNRLHDAVGWSTDDVLHLHRFDRE
jgi:hypothetical protein